MPYPKAEKIDKDQLSNKPNNITRNTFVRERMNVLAGEDLSILLRNGQLVSLMTKEPFAEKGAPLDMPALDAFFNELENGNILYYPAADPNHPDIAPKPRQLMYSNVNNIFMATVELEESDVQTLVEDEKKERQQEAAKEAKTSAPQETEKAEKTEKIVEAGTDEKTEKTEETEKTEKSVEDGTIEKTEKTEKTVKTVEDGTAEKTGKPEETEKAKKTEKVEKPAENKEPEEVSVLQAANEAENSRQRQLKVLQESELFWISAKDEFGRIDRGDVGPDGLKDSLVQYCKDNGVKDSYYIGAKNGDHLEIFKIMADNDSLMILQDTEVNSESDYLKATGAKTTQRQEITLWDKIKAIGNFLTNLLTLWLAPEKSRWTEKEETNAKIDELAAPYHKLMDGNEYDEQPRQLKVVNVQVDEPALQDVEASDDIIALMNEVARKNTPKKPEDEKTTKPVEEKQNAKEGKSAENKKPAEQGKSAENKKPEEKQPVKEEKSAEGKKPAEQEKPFRPEKNKQVIWTAKLAPGTGSTEKAETAPVVEGKTKDNLERELKALRLALSPTAITPRLRSSNPDVVSKVEKTLAAGDFEGLKAIRFPSDQMLQNPKYGEFAEQLYNAVKDNKPLRDMVVSLGNNSSMGGLRSMYSTFKRDRRNISDCIDKQKEINKTQALFEEAQAKKQKTETTEMVK